MSETLKKSRFFLASSLQAWLFEQYDTTNERAFFKNCNFGYDLIDQPFYCTLSSEGGHVDVKLHIRSEMGSFLESPDLGVRFFANGDKPEILANTNRLGGNAAETILVFYKAGMMLGAHLLKKDRYAEFNNMDTDHEGVMVTQEGEELSFRRVNGKARPTMACTTLFGGVQMMRPYQDEIMDSWMDEMLPLDEKIELAEDGDEDMMEQLAQAYLNGGEDVEVDAEKAVYWFTKLAELGHATAQFNLGLHCAKGFGIERNFEKAVYWLQKAAENGDEDAPALIERLQKAVAAEKIVATGDAQAQADLAGVYMFLGGALDQAGPEADYAMALDYAQKSAAQNNGDGLWALALAYEHGRGVKTDVNKAIECYRKGAELGHAPSQHSLACYYFRGDVLKSDHKKAFDLCMKSAQQGYGLAMKDVGRCYQFGNGVMGNMKKAVEWYEKALEVIDDPELAQKTAMFKMIGESSEHWDEDYPGVEEDDTTPSAADAPAGMMEAMELIEFVENAGYHGSTDDRGITTVDKKMIAFAERLAKKGNQAAQFVLAQYFLANECTKGQKEKANEWMDALLDAPAQDVAKELLETLK